jgi:hypothetical protein
VRELHLAARVGPELAPDLLLDVPQLQARIGHGLARCVDDARRERGVGRAILADLDRDLGAARPQPS